MAQKKTKKSVKKMNSALFLELDGTVNLIERTGNKEERYPIDGKVILNVIMQAIRRGLALSEQKTSPPYSFKILQTSGDSDADKWVNEYLGELEESKRSLIQKVKKNHGK